MLHRMHRVSRIGYTFYQHRPRWTRGSCSRLSRSRYGLHALNARNVTSVKFAMCAHAFLTVTAKNANSDARGAAIEIGSASPRFDVCWHT